MSEIEHDEREPERLSLAAASSDVLRAALNAARAERPTDAQLSAVAARVAANVAAAAGAGASAGVWTSVAVIAVLGLAAAGAFWAATRGADVPSSIGAAADAGAVADADAAAAADAAADAGAAAIAAVVDGRVLRRLRFSAPDAGAAAAAIEVDIDAELALLRTAQDALRADPARALDVAAEHTRRFGDGTLAQEREVVAIEALVALERSVEARTRAGRFTARWPRSAHSRRLAVILGDVHGNVGEK